MKDVLKLNHQHYFLSFFKTLLMKLVVLSNMNINIEKIKNLFHANRISVFVTALFIARAGKSYLIRNHRYMKKESSYYRY